RARPAPARCASKTHRRQTWLVSRRANPADRLLLFLHDLRDRGDLVALVQVHDAHALRVAADDADLADVRAVDHAPGRDEQDVVAGALGLGRAAVAHAFTAAALFAVVHRRTLLGGLVLLRFPRWGRRRVGHPGRGRHRLFLVLTVLVGLRPGGVGAERRALAE